MELGSGASSSYMIRFVLSAKEYEILLGRLQTSVKSPLWKSFPSSSSVKTHEDHESPASGLLHEQGRLFIRAYVLLSLLNKALVNRRKANQLPSAKLATVITIVPVLYRFVNALGTHFLGSRILDSSQLRPDCHLGSDSRSKSKSETLKKAKKLSKQILSDRKFTATLIPILSGLVSGSCYQLIPEGPLRSYMALYVLSKTLETIYNYLDDLELLEFKPRVFGSWCLFPFAFGQLFYSFIFHPDCCTDAFKSIMFGLSSPYFPKKPEGYPKNSAWPTREQTIKGIAWVSQRRYPKFVSPILSPTASSSSSKVFFNDPELAVLGNVCNVAHPGIKKLTSALLHPNEPSEFHAYTNMIGQNFSRISKYLFALYAAIGLSHQLSKNKNNNKDQKNNNGSNLSKSVGNHHHTHVNNHSEHSHSVPYLATSTLATLWSALLSTLRTTSFITLSTASAWAGIGLFQELTNNKFIPESRYKIIGFLSGLWAFLDQVNGRTRYMYAVRMAVLAHWNILKKQGKVKPIRNGDVVLFSLSFALLMGITEISPASVSGPLLRKTLQWIKNGSFKDPGDQFDRLAGLSSDKQL